jgi:hypothetical protein
LNKTPKNQTLQPKNKPTSPRYLLAAEKDHGRQQGLSAQGAGGRRTHGAAHGRMAGRGNNQSNALFLHSANNNLQNTAYFGAM